ncbi:MAG TPA: ABC transporter permease [Anaerolineales bacterium]|nr:ABC transporter permease [Anaerolineales bacterium]
MSSETIAISSSLGQPGIPSNLRALWAVVRREWLIFVRYPSWIIAQFVWPVIFPLSYVLTARALSGRDGSGLTQFQAATGIHDYMGYIAIGTMVWMWQNVVLWQVGFALRNEQLRGTLESNWLSPTWRFAYLLGASTPQLASMLMLLAVSGVEFSLFFGVRFQGSLWLTLLAFFAAIPAVYGLGIAFASLVITAKEANAFVFLVRGIVMIFCGITFPISILPGWMQGVTKWLPQTYIIHAIRSASLSTDGLSAISGDLQALVLFGIFWLTIGYLVFNWMERRARQTGAIGQY